MADRSAVMSVTSHGKNEGVCALTPLSSRTSASPPWRSISRKLTRLACAANALTIDAPIPLAPPEIKTWRSRKLGYVAYSCVIFSISFLPLAIEAESGKTFAYRCPRDDNRVAAAASSGANRPNLTSVRAGLRRCLGVEDRQGCLGAPTARMTDARLLI